MKKFLAIALVAVAAVAVSGCRCSPCGTSSCEKKVEKVRTCSPCKVAKPCNRGC